MDFIKCGSALLTLRHFVPILEEPVYSTLWSNSHRCDYGFLRASPARRSRWNASRIGSFRRGLFGLVDGCRVRFVQVVLSP